MATMSTTLQNSLLNATLRNVAYTSPGTVWLALYTSNPTANDTGTEVAGNGYARQTIAFNAPSAGSCTNSADVVISNMPAITITYIGLRTAATGGTLLYYAALGAAKTTNLGDAYTVRAGDLTVVMS